MANPQLEDGYLRIANDLRKALAKIRISGEAMQVLWVIFGKTYGFNKKSDHIALSQFVEETGLGKNHICLALNKLTSMKIIITEKGNGVSKYMINKDFTTWEPLPKKGIVPNKGNNRTQKRELAFPLLGHTKDTLTKDKRQCGKSQSDCPAKRFLHDFGELFKERFGTTYFASFKKDTVLVKDLLKAFEYDELTGRAKMFFRDTDEWIKKTGGYTIGSFKVRVNKYVLPKVTVVKEWTPQPEMTPEQKEAAVKALREGLEQFKNRGQK